MLVMAQRVRQLRKPPTGLREPIANQHDPTVTMVLVLGHSGATETEESYL